MRNNNNKILLMCVWENLCEKWKTKGSTHIHRHMQLGQFVCASFIIAIQIYCCYGCFVSATFQSIIYRVEMWKVLCSSLYVLIFGYGFTAMRRVRWQTARAANRSGESIQARSKVYTTGFSSRLVVEHLVVLRLWKFFELYRINPFFYRLLYGRGTRRARKMGLNTCKMC